MKTTHIFGIALISIALVLALVIANFNQSFASAQLPSQKSIETMWRTVPVKNLGAAPISIQTTPTLSPEDASEIGSTDGILIMGIVIVLIVIMPVLFYKKK